MKNSRTLPGGIVHFWNLDTQAPQVGPSFLGVKKEKVCYRATSAWFEHGAFGPKPLTFTPEPILPKIWGMYQTHLAKLKVKSPQSRIEQHINSHCQ